MKKDDRKHIVITKSQSVKKLPSKISSELQDNYKKKCKELGIEYIPIKEVPDDYTNIFKRHLES